jgi:multiple sugar transport system ATP-binding protein
LTRSSVHLAGVSKQFGTTPVIGEVTLGIEPGEFIVFVGPSGCGKSTLLRLIAGLEEPSAGSIHISGRDVTREHPSQRGVAMVFQSYALYPHMSVAENMAFGLKIQKSPKAEIEARVRRAATILQLEPLLDRKPRALSGGQRQRVAIGRAIVREPDVFLFDEPLSNLDASLRGQMRIEIARLHAQLGATMVYVTHDQVEAMTLASRIVVLNAGRIEQIGAPMELYRQPANLFVAGFLGSPGMNFLPGVVVRTDGGAAELDVAGARIAIAGGFAAFASGGNSGASNSNGGIRGGDIGVTVGIRPEHIGFSSGEHGVPGQVAHIERLGGEALVHVRVGPDDLALVAKAAGGASIAAGERVRLSFDPGDMHLFDHRGEAVRSIA